LADFLISLYKYFLTKNVFAPSTGETPAVIEGLSLLRKTHYVYVVRIVQGGVQFEEGDVVVKCPSVVFGVDQNLNNVAVLMREQFVFGLRVPLAGSDFQTLVLFTARKCIIAIINTNRILIINFTQSLIKI